MWIQAKAITAVSSRVYVVLGVPRNLKGFINKVPWVYTVTGLQAAGWMIDRLAAPRLESASAESGRGGN